MIKLGVRLLLVLVLGLLLSCTEAVPTDQVSVLFIGNSHTFYNDMPEILRDIASSKGINLRVEYQRDHGFSLTRHWEDELALAAIKGGQWDYVVLQEQSETPVTDRESFHSAVRAFDQEIQALGAKTVLYAANIQERELDALEQRINEVTQSYQAIAQEIGSDIVPAGLAWVHSLKQRPELELYNADKVHSSPRGAYFTACLFFSVLFEQSPEGAGAANLEDIASDEEILYLQKTAWEFAQDFNSQ